MTRGYKRMKSGVQKGRAGHTSKRKALIYKAW